VFRYFASCFANEISNYESICFVLVMWFVLLLFLSCVWHWLCSCHVFCYLLCSLLMTCFCIFSYTIGYNGIRYNILTHWLVGTSIFLSKIQKFSSLSTFIFYCIINYLRLLCKLSSLKYYELLIISRYQAQFDLYVFGF